MLTSPQFYRRELPDGLIMPLNVGKLNGRVLRTPPYEADTSQQIFFFYGHHALIERWWGLIHQLNEYGAVVAPDLPGFGGMSIAPRIDQGLDILDYLADVLAETVLKSLDGSRVVFAGLSFGFVVAIRMLRRHPDLAARADLVLSFSGFLDGADLKTPKAVDFLVRTMAKITRSQGVSRTSRRYLINRWSIHALDLAIPASRRRLSRLTPSERNELNGLETFLWQNNDVETHWSTLLACFDLTNGSDKVDVPLVHVYSEADAYVDHERNVERMRGTFRSVLALDISTQSHTLDLNADLTEYAALVPDVLRDILRNSMQADPQ